MEMIEKMVVSLFGLLASLGIGGTWVDTKKKIADLEEKKADQMSLEVAFSEIQELHTCKVNQAECDIHHSQTTKTIEKLEKSTDKKFEKLFDRQDDQLKKLSNIDAKLEILTSRGGD